MPVATVPDLITRPEHLVEYLAYLLESSDIPFAYIAKYDENLIPQYPAAHIQSGAYDKSPHGTHTFLIGIRAYIYIMHAKLTTDHRTRSLEDLELATEVVALLESQRTLGNVNGSGRVIHGHVESEQPALFPTRKNEGVVGTRLQYHCIQETRFK